MYPATSLLPALHRQGVRARPERADVRIQQHRQLKSTLQQQVADVTARCERHVARQAPWRELRARVASLEQSIAARRARVANIEAMLVGHVRQSRPRPPKTTDTVALVKAEITTVKRQQRAVDSRIIAARQVLVKEAAAVMGLKRWEIAGLALPPVKEIRRTFLTCQC